ncbi:hypothetical protein ZIOFF_062953 [Zingiber officinale]|uniref:Retrotransposon Copia-like N-terminal domain-containing protein n=1 Tax=Zingiber officinale TaxID=94328 RepID=A0A8J5KFI7_ZINOF|nr:hypothetical protein ZIOFF_062953 [Zingiber officinale]
MSSGMSDGAKGAITPNIFPTNIAGFESSSIQLTIHKLNGKNYLEWAQSIKLVIDKKGHLGYLMGEVAAPDKDDPKWKSWKSENSMHEYHKRMESDRVYVFLAGLNRELDEVRGRILGRNPLPSSSEVFAEGGKKAEGKSC